ncbi:PEP/pyruvate-binding domain-containing protein [Akkermansiaceae bacterium]|nr:PEP/pyruvate-binding domain-containing protein [Akkermansiaceae bacterium]
MLSTIAILHAQESHQILPQENGKFSLTVPESQNHYAILYRSRDLKNWKPVDLVPQWWDSDARVLKDPGLPHQNGFYEIRFQHRNTPGDLDLDGRNDLAEISDENDFFAAFNPADPFDEREGALFLKDLATYNTLSKRDNFPGAQSVKEVKFLITDIQTNPRLHFINVNENQYHYDFARYVLSQYREFDYYTGNSVFSSQTYFSNNRINLAGSLISHENYLGPDGKRGIYTMEFWPTDPVSFEHIQIAYELISRTTPFIDRLVYHAPSETQRNIQEENREQFESSFIDIIQTDVLFSNIDYQPMNQEAAFGRLILASTATTLSARDIVIFENLPNDLTHIAGIITEIPQTPLSHINLKAKQNNTPNAFISNASIDSRVAPFIGENIFFQVSPDGFEIRLASQEELDTYFDSIRPSTTSYPPRDLTITTIEPFTSISFDDTNAFGGKTTNLAVLYDLMPDKAPNGYGIPFYFYDEFMKHNNYYAEAIAMMAEEDFQNDPAVREERLKEFRKRIKTKSSFPSWMIQALTVLQDSFDPEITPRLRSSANAEDSVEFNGAGLYDSFTHKADEGHITKSVRQVYASLWNYRAYEERDFYRIDHLTAAMGITVHPNFKNEQANGVAVARNIFDPAWEGYYVNSQIGENLVTNPELNSTPEELLAADLLGTEPYEIQYIRYSNQLPAGETVLTKTQVLELVDTLKELNSHFRFLNRPVPSDFAMEVEFKITETGDLVIKQARPWIN